MATRDPGGYLSIEDYGLIGDMHTCALVARDGSIDYMCWPQFDSPSLFCRMLDSKIGGHWSINPIFPKDEPAPPISKQQYVAASNLLRTKWIHEDGVIDLTDFFVISESGYQVNVASEGPPAPALYRKLECLRGQMEMEIEICPKPDYARPENTHRFIPGKVQKVGSSDWHQSVSFTELHLPTVHVVYKDGGKPSKIFEVYSPEQGSNCNGVRARVRMSEGQEIIFLLTGNELDQQLSNGAETTNSLNVRPVRTHSPRNSKSSTLAEGPDEAILRIVRNLPAFETQTKHYWRHWIRKCHYRGRFQQEVERSLLLLKLLTYRPSGAIVAAPTFSVPEAVGGTRNWDYRYSWVRDSSFTVYVFLKMGFTDEAEAYINFIFARIEEWHKSGGGKPLPLMFSINGESDLPELTLDHLSGYKNTAPVRIGNAATGHIQLDIYGELMDAIYLFNKHGKPITYDQWDHIRHLINYVATVWDEPDMSIWEVRGRKENFVYSKMLLWVAFDRATRLSDKRCFPCHERLEWMRVKDTLYEEIMEKGYNSSLKSFIQSYESNEVLDAAVLIAPLVFFIGPNDPRFLGTLDQILKTPEKGGLTSAGLVFRYNHQTKDDGVGGKEGTFVMCTFWLIEALIRAGVYDKTYLGKAVSMLETVLSFSNHLGMFSEEIAISGEQLGNTPQAFSHLAFISAAYNLRRVGEGVS